MIKKVVFLTATRADFGKLKSLIQILKKNKKYKVIIIVTGMHMIKKYGDTHKEVTKYFKSGVIKFTNQSIGDPLEIILSKTVKKISLLLKKINPDLIVTHGDRVETLACAISASLNHILTAHIEGGELTGTIDDTIRHSVTKLSHAHFVSNNKAKKRVIKMGEDKKNVFNIGSSDLDTIKNNKLPTLREVKKRYNIYFRNYAILIWHPVTSELKSIKKNTKILLSFLERTKENYIVIYPNNDPGGKDILDSYIKIKNKKFKIFPSLRFTFFTTLLKNSKFIIGNSSCGIYEAPYFKVPTINIGTRQNKRFLSRAILNLNINNLKNEKIYSFLKNYKPLKYKTFGDGNSDKKFLKILKNKNFWNIKTQKIFDEK